MLRQTRYLLLLPIALFSACAPVVVVHDHRPPPPPLRVEVIGVAPYSGAHWVRGHWAWRRGEYVWIPGHWSHPGYYY